MGLQLFHGPVPDWLWHNFYGPSPPSADSRTIVVSYKRKYVHEVLVNRLVKLAQEKMSIRWTDHLDLTIAVDCVLKKQTALEFIFISVCTVFAKTNQSSEKEM